jgi:hypothetical protein
MAKPNTVRQGDLTSLRAAYPLATGRKTQRRMLGVPLPPAAFHFIAKASEIQQISKSEFIRRLVAEAEVKWVQAGIVKMFGSDSS